MFIHTDSMNRASDTGGYSPSPNGVHRGRSGPEYRLRPRDGEWVVVAPAILSPSQLTVHLGVTVLISAPWLLIGMVSGVPAWVPWTGVGAFGFGTLMTFGRQWLASMQGPVLTIRSKSLDFANEGRISIPREGLVALELVRYEIHSHSSVIMGLRQLVADFGDAATPRFVQLPIVALNIDDLARDLAKALEVPLRERDLGTIQGDNFVSY